uniref:Uncharacterized protein n=1 Tax=Bracon brevicornis TaxID=1563983 RepID=A0A6V7JI55_9HYME
MSSCMNNTFGTLERLNEGFTEMAIVPKKAVEQQTMPSLPERASLSSLLQESMFTLSKRNAMPPPQPDVEKIRKSRRRKENSLQDNAQPEVTEMETDLPPLNRANDKDENRKQEEKEEEEEEQEGGKESIATAEED